MVRVDVANTGDRAGDEVVQLYVRDEEANVARPVLELRGFRRVSLPRASAATVAFTLHAEQFAYTGVDHRGSSSRAGSRSMSGGRRSIGS